MTAVGLVQMRTSERPDENLARALDGIREAARQGAQIVCTQELFRSRYFCQAEDPARFELAEPIPGPTSEAQAASRSWPRSSSGAPRASTTTRRW
jgi:N-carbamoylputrescine amidase